MTIFFSIIVPAKSINDYILQEIIPALKKQSYKNFELIIVADKPEVQRKLSHWARIILSNKNNGPAKKRDLGVSQAKGNIIVFIDDDVYPSKLWLQNSLKYFQNKKVAAVCGPAITPSNDNFRQKLSGYFWSSWLGAGGAGTYRNRFENPRKVDDYPTFNLAIRKKDFLTVGGFNSSYWPGEDTKLCLDLVYKLGKEIIYDPKIYVFHHRREIFIPHLKQIAGYGLHRGFFVKKFPKTSKRIGYFLPFLFFISLTALLLLTIMLYLSNYLLLFYITKNILLLLTLFYFIALIVASLNLFWRIKNIWAVILFPAVIFLSHLVYGIMFAKGLMLTKLDNEDLG